MRAVKTFLVVTCLVLPGCKKDKPDAPPPVTTTGSAATDTGSSAAVATDTGSAAGSGSAVVETAGSGELQDVGSAVDPTAMSHHAQRCPSMVHGATTTAKLEGKSVVVTVTSTDQAVATKIQTRAEELLKDKAVAKLAGDQPTAAHAQNGTHGGGIGICPVHVPEGATAKSTTLANGVAVKITPRSNAAELAKDIEQRIARAADWIKSNSDDDGDGGGKGNGGGGGNGNGHGKHRGG
jgi:hypothetical protein